MNIFTTVRNDPEFVKDLETLQVHWKLKTTTDTIKQAVSRVYASENETAELKQLLHKIIIRLDKIEAKLGVK